MREWGTGQIWNGLPYPLGVPQAECCPGGPAVLETAQGTWVLEKGEAESLTQDSGS